MRGISPLSPHVEPVSGKIETHVLSVVGNGGRPTGGLWSSMGEGTIGAAFGDHHSPRVISQTFVLSRQSLIKV